MPLRNRKKSQQPRQSTKILSKQEKERLRYLFYLLNLDKNDPRTKEEFDIYLLDRKKNQFSRRRSKKR